jgi:DNA-binding NtrC family response regulator
VAQDSDPKASALLKKVREYIASANEQLGTEIKDISDEVKDFIISYDWSEEDRQLEIAVKRACILSDDEILQLEDFDLQLRQARSIGRFIEVRLSGFMKKISRLEKFNLYSMVIDEVEKSLITMVLKETKGNQVKASRLLGINRNTLRNKIKKLNIKI